MDRGFCGRQLASVVALSAVERSLEPVRLVGWL
jgi:hypothetical protein